MHREYMLKYIDLLQNIIYSFLSPIKFIFLQISLHNFLCIIQ